jgi:hypothetical protein
VCTWETKESRSSTSSVERIVRVPRCSAMYTRSETLVATERESCGIFTCSTLALPESSGATSEASSIRRTFSLWWECAVACSVAHSRCWCLVRISASEMNEYSDAVFGRLGGEEGGAALVRRSAIERKERCDGVVVGRFLGGEGDGAVEDADGAMNADGGLEEVGRPASRRMAAAASNSHSRADRLAQRGAYRQASQKVKRARQTCLTPQTCPGTQPPLERLG